MITLPLFPLSSKKNTKVQKKFTCLIIHTNKNSSIVSLCVVKLVLTSELYK